MYSHNSSHHHFTDLERGWFKQEKNLSNLEWLKRGEQIYKKLHEENPESVHFLRRWLTLLLFIGKNQGELEILGYDQKVEQLSNQGKFKHHSDYLQGLSYYLDNQFSKAKSCFLRYIENTNHVHDHPHILTERMKARYYLYLMDHTCHVFVDNSLADYLQPGIELEFCRFHNQACTPIGLDEFKKLETEIQPFILFANHELFRTIKKGNQIVQLPFLEGLTLEYILNENGVVSIDQIGVKLFSDWVNPYDKAKKTIESIRFYLKDHFEQAIYKSLKIYGSNYKWDYDHPYIIVRKK